MAVLNLPAVAGAGLLLYLFYQHFIVPAFISPLSKVPAAHWSCHFSPLWLYWVRYTHKENRLVYRCHMEKGKALRLSPTVLSLNCFEGGLKQIYLGGFPKTDFYTKGFANYETENIFTFEDNATHSARKRIISGTFSKSYIMANRTARSSTERILFGRLLPLLLAASKEDKPVEVLETSYSYSMDSFVNWQFGNTLASNLLEDDEERRLYLDGFFAAQPYTFWQYEFPSLNRVFKMIGLIPKKVDSGFHDIERWNLEKCDKAQELLAQKGEDGLPEEDKPVVMNLALKAMSEVTAKPKTYPQRLEIASDMFAHNSAAHETSGNTLCYTIFELSKRPGMQAKLREELLTLDSPLKYPFEGKEPVLPPAKDVDNLPLLEAVIMETLRMYPPVPGGQPRAVPKPCSLGGYDNIPPGTVVQCSAYTLHRTPEIFPDPEEWRPERWIESTPEQLSQMRRWFWAFGSGGRMCIGSNFAWFSMKHAIGSIYTNFTTEIHDHGSMELQDAYLAGPTGHRLQVKFRHI